MAVFAQGLKTVMLLGLLTGLMLGIGQLVGGQNGMMIALGLAALMNLGSWWFSDKLVLAATRAQKIEPSEQPKLHAMVQELSRTAGIPAPALYMVPDPSPNAFATGRGPGHAVVAVNQGLLSLLPEREVRGVIAHEIAHIKHRDILISSVAATIAGAIMMIASMARWAAIFGGLGGRSDGDRGGGGLIQLLVLAVLAPLAASLVHMAVSRSREYAADAEGGAISGDPGALADALLHLQRGISFQPSVNQSAGTIHHIMHPFSGGSMLKLFSTHPPTEERVRRLRAMKAGGRP
jgi:heat shock protein HtpX